MVGIKFSLIVFGLSLLSLSANGDKSNRQKSLSQQRIINGVQVDIRDYKYYTYLRDNRGTSCGGALVHLNKIVTAAHCCLKFRTPLYAYPGINNLNELSTTRKYLAGVWYSHPWFDWDDTDICVVILTENVVFNDKIALISLARYLPPIGSYITVVGHGITDCSIVVNEECIATSSDPLMKTSLAVIGYQGPSIVLRVTHNRTCFGDSGGPFTYRGKLVGVVSRGSKKFCKGDFEYAESPVRSPIREFLGDFGIYPE